VAENKTTIELGIEFVIELLLFLYPYGAEQMGLPHNFWLGLSCWFFGTIIAIRMFWIFPVWSSRLTKLEKALISFIMVGLFVLTFYRPVMKAYEKRNISEETQKPSPSPQEKPKQEPPPAQEGTKAKPIPPAKPTSKAPVDANPKSSKPEQRSPDNQVCEQSNCIAGDNYGNPTVNNFGPPSPQLSWTQRDVIPAVEDDGHSTPSQFKYEKEVIVSVTSDYTPVALGVECDTELKRVNGSLKIAPGAGAVLMNHYQFIGETGKIAFVYFEGMAATPTRPVLIHIWSAQPFNVLRVGQARIKGLNF